MQSNVVRRSDGPAPAHSKIAPGGPDPVVVSSVLIRRARLRPRGTIPGSANKWETGSRRPPIAETASPPQPVTPNVVSKMKCLCLVIQKKVTGTDPNDWVEEVRRSQLVVGPTPAAAKEYLPRMRSSAPSPRYATSVLCRFRRWSELHARLWAKEIPLFSDMTVA